MSPEPSYAFSPGEELLDRRNVISEISDQAAYSAGQAAH